ncbi:MAG: ABC transporter ATP-binding protein [bacterium]|nr:ABC transporter ATP-binding protein [bacterium]
MTAEGKTAGQSLPISVRNVVKAYGPLRALDDMSIDVRAGEFMTLLGPSGSGKTTLLMALAGFVSPESGSIRFGGQEMVTVPPHKRGVGMVFQSYALFPFMSVEENVAYPLKIRRVSAADQKARVEAALELVQLGGYGGRRVHQLSGGQMQRVALARAMVFEPRIILMDEPLSALDKKLREQMQIELKALHRKLDATIVYVTHDQREALTMSDRIAVINQGRIAQLDTPEALYRRPKSLFVADFIGESVVLPVVLHDGAATLNGCKLKTTSSFGSAEGPYHLVIRPELLELSPDSSDGLMNDLSGEVREVIYQGDSALVLVRVGVDQEISLRVPASRAGSASIPDIAQRISLGLHAEDTIIVPETAL